MTDLIREFITLKDELTFVLDLKIESFRHVQCEREESLKVIARSERPQV